MINKKTINSDFKWIVEFSKAFSDVDIKSAYNDFIKFDSNLGAFVKELENANFIATYRLKNEAKDSKMKTLNLLTELSLNLVKAIQKCSLSLNSYISMSNNLYKPMQTLFKDLDLFLDTESAKEIFINDVEEMLIKMKPIYISLNKELKSVYKENLIIKNELEDKSKIIFQKSTKLNKFITKYDENSDFVKIYMKLLKASSKIPSSVSLALASDDNKISKSSWDRILKNSAYLKILIREIEKLIKRTKNQSRLEFYKHVFSKLDQKYHNGLIIEFDAKRIKSKNKYVSDEDEDSKTSDEHIQDGKQYNDYLYEENE